MTNHQRKRVALTAAGIAALVLVNAPHASASEGELHCFSLGETARAQTGALPSPLAQIRIACPVLADIIVEYAELDLGEAFLQNAAEIPSPELALATRFATLGDVSAMTRHARRAHDVGTKPAEIRELIYLTAVSAGFPKAMEATRALAGILTPPLAASSATSREACIRSNLKMSILEN
jgi:4-carboxymuconolactone decarboxylase